MFEPGGGVMSDDDDDSPSRERKRGHGHGNDHSPAPGHGHGYGHGHGHEEHDIDVDLHHHHHHHGSTDSLTSNVPMIMNLGNAHGKMTDEVILRKKGYSIGKILGEGAYAKVYVAEFVEPRNPRKRKVLACKVIDGDRAPRDFIKKFFPRELNMMCKLNHHYIVRIHSIMKLSGRYYLCMTYCENGDLLGFMKENGAIRENRARRWFAQLLEGMGFMHDKNIAHRDLKCENILLNGAYNVKIADFGFARLFTDNDDKSTTFCGSIMYAPPEVVHGNPYDPRLADIWSLGVVLFIMLNKSMPFDDSTLRKLYECQMSRSWKIRNKIKDMLSQDVKTFIYNILEPVPEKRRTTHQLRQDIWILKGSFSDATLRNASKDSLHHGGASHRHSSI